MPSVDNFQTTPVDTAEVKTAAAMENPEAASKELTIDDVLKEIDLTMDAARDIVDALFTDGVYTEEFKLGRKRSVTFRTRTSKEEQRLRQKLHNLGEATVDQREYLILMHNLATSIVSYADTDLSAGTDEAAYQQRFEYVNSLPAPVVSMLSTCLSRFDYKVMVACSEPVLKDF